MPTPSLSHAVQLRSVETPSATRNLPASRPLRVSFPNAAGRGPRAGKEDAVTITNNPSVRQVLAAVVADPQYPALARRPLLS